MCVCLFGWLCICFVLCIDCFADLLISHPHFFPMIISTTLPFLSFLSFVFPLSNMPSKTHKLTRDAITLISAVSQHLSFSSTDRNTLKELSQYGLDILRNEEDDQVCFGLNLVDNTVEVPIGVVVRHFDPDEIVDYLLPLKKMKYLGVEVLVPNNPIAFLEKVYEDKNDVLKDVDLFKETNSKMDEWKKAGVLKRSDV